MKFILITCCLLTLAGTNSRNTPQKACKTTFVVNDCDGVAVPGAAVRITKCSDGTQLGSSTDAQGRASFSICKSDICKTKVSLIGYSAKTTDGLAGNCSGNEQNTTCVIKICDKGDD